MGLIGSPNTTTLNQRVVYMQNTNDPHKYSASGLRYSAILSKTSLIGLIAFDFKENPLAQTTVPCDNLASHLCIIYYFTNTNFIQSLILQQEVVVTALVKIVFIKHPLKLLVDFIYKVQEMDTFIYFIYNQLT